MPKLQAIKTVLQDESKDLQEAIANFFKMHGFNRTYWIALSGGLDSQVLLALCHAYCLNNIEADISKLRVIHINHGMSVNALAWETSCALLCKAYGIQFFHRTLQLRHSLKKSIEELAREKRYAIFAEYLKTNDILLTAHHQDDQAETLLTQLIRGAGLKGLAAMPKLKPFASGFHARPLLSFPREILKNYAIEKELSWIEDESNQNIEFTRNFMRHEILPLLKKRFPAVVKTLARSAQHCAEAQILLHASFSECLAQVKGTDAQTLSVSKLLELDHARQKFILRTWISELNFPLPNEKKLTAIQENVLTAAWDGMPCVKWKNVELRRYRDNLYLHESLIKHDHQQSYDWNFLEPLILPNIGTLRAVKVLGQGLSLHIKEVCVQFRRGGENIFIANCGHRTLKNIFQEKNIPPWQRYRIPLLFAKDKLIGIVGFLYDEAYKVSDKEWGWEIHLDATTFKTHSTCL